MEKPFLLDLVIFHLNKVKDGTEWELMLSERRCRLVSFISEVWE